MQTTGNAGGCHNLLVRGGDLDFRGLLLQMGRGLLVTELLGHGVNYVTGDYSGAAGYWVEGGEICHPVEEITIAGNLRDMFRGIVAVGNCPSVVAPSRSVPSLSIACRSPAAELPRPTSVSPCAVTALLCRKVI